MTDITLRDGLQSLPTVYSTADNAAIHAAILGVGFTDVEGAAELRTMIFFMSVPCGF